MKSISFSSVCHLLVSQGSSSKDSIFSGIDFLDIKKGLLFFPEDDDAFSDLDSLLVLDGVDSLLAGEVSFVFED